MQARPNAPTGAKPPGSPWRLVSPRAVLAAACLWILSGCSGPTVPDLTRKTAAEFRAHVDKMVVLQGRMEEGRHGLVLYGAIPGDVTFYIMPAVSNSRAFEYPEAWKRRLNREVRVTGMLKLRKLEGPGGSPLTQGAVDFYYMVLQQAQITDPLKK